MTPPSVSIPTLSEQLNQVDDRLDTLRKDINNILEKTYTLFFTPKDYPYPLLTNRLKKTVEAALEAFKEVDNILHLKKKLIDQEIKRLDQNENIYLTAKSIEGLWKTMIFAIHLYKQEIAPRVSELAACHKIGLSNHQHGLEPDQAHREQAEAICYQLEEIQEKLEDLESVFK